MLPGNLREGGAMLTQGDKGLIPFSDAVPRVYEEITGTSLSAFAGLLIDALLNEVSQAIADLVTIYGAPDDQVPVKPLPWAEVKLGVFQRAATVIRTSDGIEYQRLYIRRCDARAAATVLKKSGARFASAEELQAALDSAEVRRQAAFETGTLS
jgi:hypothetical protein